MKKTILLSATAVLISSAAVYAQNDNAFSKNEYAALTKKETPHRSKKSGDKVKADKPVDDQVSYQSKQQFYEEFGSVPGTVWERDGKFDKATFTIDGVSKKAFYDTDGKLVGTIMDKSFKDLPASARRYIDKKYAGYARGNVVYFDDNELNETDMVLFGQPFEDEDNYFVELSRGDKDIVLEVSPQGRVAFFKNMR